MVDFLGVCLDACVGDILKAASTLGAPTDSSRGNRIFLRVRGQVTIGAYINTYLLEVKTSLMKIKS